MDLLNLGYRTAEAEDLCPETFLDIEWIDQTFAGRAWVYRNIWLNGELFLKVVIVSPWGLIAIIPYRNHANAEDGVAVRRILGVDASGSRILYHSEEISLVLSDDGRSLTPVTDIYCYLHRLLIGMENDTTKKLDSAFVSRFLDTFETLEDGERPETDADEAIGSDGQLYVKRHDPVMLGPIDLGLAGRKSWYPVADDDTDRLVTMAAFGGWFGLHCFAEGEIASGLLYALSCGCVGILPMMDIIQYLTGTKMIRHVEYQDDGELTRVRVSMFLRKPRHVLWGIACIFIALAMGLIAWHVIYKWALPMILRELYTIEWK